MTPLATWLEHKTACGAVNAAAALKLDHPAAVESSVEEMTGMALRLREEIRAELTEQFETARQTERTALLAEFEQLRVAKIADQGAALGQSIRSAIELLKSELSDGVARVLAPLLSRNRVAAAYDEFIAAVFTAQTNAAGTRLTIRGPERLLEAIRAKAKDLPMTVTYLSSDDVDASATIDDTVVETCISDWLQMSGLG